MSIQRPNTRSAYRVPYTPILMMLMNLVGWLRKCLVYWPIIKLGYAGLLILIPDLAVFSFFSTICCKGRFLKKSKDDGFLRIEKVWKGSYFVRLVGPAPKAVHNHVTFDVPSLTAVVYNRIGYRNTYHIHLSCAAYFASWACYRRIVSNIIKLYSWEKKVHEVTTFNHVSLYLYFLDICIQYHDRCNEQ